MTTDYRRQAVRGAALTLVAAAMVFALGSLGFAPSMTLFVIFAVVAAVLLGGWYALDRPWYLTGVWIVPVTVAAVMILSGNSPAGELRTVGIMLAALGVVTVVIWPSTAYFAQLGESAGNRLIDDE